MSEAATTSGTPESDSVRPSLSLEDAAEIDFYDPEENQETVAADQMQHSENETDEATGQESEDIEASEGGDDAANEEGAGEEDQASTPEPDDNATITVNGEKLTVAELKKGYFREADYTRQKQTVSNKERDLGALSARVSQSVEAISDFLVNQIPPAPNPQLAMTDPGKFVQQKALHEAAVQQVVSLISQANEVKGVSDSLTAEQRRELISSEDAKLVEAFPTTATKDGREKFFATAATAAKELGYSDDEIKQAMDHRMFALAHYAAIGMRAEKSREKANEKVLNAPPVAPQRQRQQGARQDAVRRNQEAKKRLARTGSIDDAVAIDWD